MSLYKNGSCRVHRLWLQSIGAHLDGKVCRRVHGIRNCCYTARQLNRHLPLCRQRIETKNLKRNFEGKREKQPTPKTARVHFPKPDFNFNLSFDRMRQKLHSTIEPSHVCFESKTVQAEGGHSGPSLGGRGRG